MEERGACSMSLPECETNLVSRCLQGEAAAWETMVHSYGRRIQCLAYRYVPRHEEAEDLAQEVFLRVYRNLDTYRADAGSLHNWLVRVGRNLIIDHIRSLKRLRKYCDSRDVEALKVQDENAPAPDRGIERSEAFALLAEGFRFLTSDIRQVVVLRYFEGMSYQEIADHMGIPEGTVKSRINRGIDKMRVLLAKGRLRGSGSPAAGVNLRALSSHRTVMPAVH